jgi:hypothetical protein
MTENTDEDADKSSTENLTKLREMALRGDDYREVIDFSYYGLEGELYVRPLNDLEFLPIAAFLEDRMDMDVDEAQEALEEGKDEVDDTIDPGQFDEDFVGIMHEAAKLGIDRKQGIAAGEDKEGISEIVEMLQGGKSLIIAEQVLEISSNADKAEKFRRDGGGE